MQKLREKNGRIQRKNFLWTEENWNYGYYDNRGRFRVYRPDYPKAYNEGYALRSHVVFWLHHGTVPQKGEVIHHINKIKDDDRIENLELMKLTSHTHLHCKMEDGNFICEHCGKHFIVDHQRVHQREMEGKKIKFCSQDCYHNHRRIENYKNKISKGLKKV